MSMGRLHHRPLPPTAPTTASLDVAGFTLPRLDRFDESPLLARRRSVPLLPRQLSPASPYSYHPFASSSRTGGRSRRRCAGECVGDAAEAFVGGAFHGTGPGRRLPGTPTEATRYRYRSAPPSVEINRFSDERKRESSATASASSFSYSIHSRSSLRRPSSQQIHSAAQSGFSSRRRLRSEGQYEQRSSRRDNGSGSRNSDAALQVERLWTTVPHDGGINASSFERSCRKWEADVLVLLGYM